MNRRNIIIVGATIILLTILALLFMRPTYTVSITFDKPNLSAKLYRIVNKNPSEVTTLSGDSKIQLQDGQYMIKTSSKSNTIKESSVEFTVEGKGREISIKTEYSQKFITQKMTEYRNNILSTLFAKYPELQSSFILQREILLGKDIDWYAASYQRPTVDRNSGDIYTVIMKKENNKWVIKTRPQIINTTYNTKDIPEEILSEIASRLSPFSINS
jgi:hypothetical protein